MSNGDGPQGVSKLTETLTGAFTDGAEAGAEFFGVAKEKVSMAAQGPPGPLESLYSDKYRKSFLQYPLNVEAPDENHWVRFDIQALKGAPVKQDEARVSSSDDDGSFLGRIADGVAEKASALVTSALMAPVNIAKSTVSSFLNDLPPALGGIGKDFLGMSGASRVQGMGSIMLYAPHTRQENLKYNWAQESTGLTGGFLKGAPQGDIFNTDDNTFIQSIKDRGDVALIQVGALLAEAGTGNQTLVELVGKNNGVAINPHLEMFFRSVDFRSFSFDFKLAPRNAPEARQIREIINLFKYASTPGYFKGEAGLYLAYPNVFDISFFNEAQTHKIARSALTGISVNHSAAGVNTTFYDDYPAETSLNLTFTELEIMHKDKIDQGY